jgi:hypothetical protein
MHGFIFLLALFLYFHLYRVFLIPFYPQASGAAPPDHSPAGSSLPSVDVPHAGPLKPIGGNHPQHHLLHFKLVLKLGSDDLMFQCSILMQ